MELPGRFSHYIELTNAALDRLVPPEATPPEPIYNAIRYSLFAGGKRLRPILCLSAAESLHADAERLVPVAAAIEMIHTYSLVHDDLPAMDNDDFRRGKPTNHKVFGEAIAILAGDALLTHALESLAVSGYSPQVRCRLIGMLARAAGTSGMIGGQVLDMVSEARVLSRIELEQLHSMKTAALIRFSAMSAAIALEAGDEAERALEQYGSSVGLAFQIVDDILDVEGTTDVLGKTAGKDARSRKVTYPSLIGIEESRKLASDLIENACSVISRYDPHSYLSTLARHVLERNS